MNFEGFSFVFLMQLCLCVSINACLCIYALFGTSGTRYFISCQDEWRHTSRNERRGGIKQRSESMARQDGNREKKKCVSGLIVPLMSLQAVTPLCGTLHYPSVRVR